MNGYEFSINHMTVKNRENLAILALFKHRHARRASVIFLIKKVVKMGAFKRLFTVII